MMSMVCGAEKHVSCKMDDRVKESTEHTLRVGCLITGTGVQEEAGAQSTISRLVLLAKK